MLNLRSVDLNLLPVFEVIYEEKRLSQAATRLAMTQPAVSKALSRLRHVFKDELFIRHSRGVTPTALADEIYGRIGDAMRLVRATITDTRGFDPKRSERRFFVTIPHPLGPMLALRLLKRMEKLAPGVSLEFSTKSRPTELERGLLNGSIDLAVDWLPAGQPALSDEEVVQDELVVVARRGHRGLRKGMTRKALVASRKFVLLWPRLDAATHPLEAAREWLDLEPKVALHVSEFIEVLVVAAESDLVGLVPRSLATASSRALDIQLLATSPRPKAFPIRMVWRTGRPDAAHTFLRAQVRATMKEVIKG
jgi:DNA-binding transcriptional LysR family regulator